AICGDRREVRIQRTIHCAAEELAARVREANVAAIEREIAFEPVDDQRRKRELINDDVTSSAQTLGRRDGLGASIEKRQHAVEEIFTGTWIEPLVQNRSIEMIRRQREAPAIRRFATVQGSIPVGRESLCRGQYDMRGAGF